MDLKDLNPQEHGRYYIVTCPKCGRREAFIYKDEVLAHKKDPSKQIKIRCNRINNCGYVGYLKDLETKNVVPVIKKESGISKECQDRFQSLYELNDAVNGFDMDIRGISNQVLKENKVMFWKSGFQGFLFNQSEGYDKEKFGQRIYADRELMFPIVDANDHIVRLLLRSVSRSLPKKEIQLAFQTSTTEIFNLVDARSSRIRYLFICEGCFDALSIKEAAKRIGRNDIGAIGIPGCKKVRKVLMELYAGGYLQAKKVIFALDNDRAGLRSLLKGELFMMRQDLPFTAFDLHGNKDLNDFLQADIDGFTQELKHTLQRCSKEPEGEKQDEEKCKRTKDKDDDQPAQRGDQPRLKLQGRLYSMASLHIKK